MIVTLRQRREREVTRLRHAAGLVVAELSAYAASHGGRFLVFGSVARGEMQLGSDFDVVVDFPHAATAAARFAEASCQRLGIVPDVHFADELPDALRQRVERDAVVLK